MRIKKNDKTNIQLELQESSTKYIYQLFQNETFWVDDIIPQDKTIVLGMDSITYETVNRKVFEKVANHIMRKYPEFETVWLGDLIYIK